MIRQTPTLRFPALELTGAGTNFIKLECFQRTGSFKLRGAVRAIAALSADDRARGVVCASAGNHGAGLALSAAEQKVPVTVVVPMATPRNKIARIRGLGAELIEKGEGYDASETVARQLASETGRKFVSPFDDEDVIEGNGGDLLREILDQVPGAHRVVVPVGGGGLMGGAARAVHELGDRVEVIGVEPEANCAMADSLRLGAAQVEYHGGETIADGCEGAVCERTYRLVAEHGAGVVTVSEEQIADAIRFLYQQVGVMAEPSGALPIAALRSGAVPPSDDPACVTVWVVTGGNIDDDVLDRILTS